MKRESRREETIKLSEPQQAVIYLMQEGWELGKSLTMDGRAWMQKNGLGKGGESKDVRTTTLFALVDRGLIEGKAREFPKQRYVLTEKGKQCKV